MGHIWNVCKVSGGIRAMPSHVNNQKLQPRFQRVSERSRRSRVSHLRLCTIDRRLPLLYARARAYVRVYLWRAFVRVIYAVTRAARSHTRPPIYRAALVMRYARDTSGPDIMYVCA